MAAELADLNDNYAVVPADKESNNIVFVCQGRSYRRRPGSEGFNIHVFPSVLKLNV